ncbi:MAG: hypothetical protein ACTSYV_03490 [Candidatus Heimdallarchaeaceae archaeon]
MLKKILSGLELPIGITHIAGPPNSGKTTLIYQVCKFLHSSEKILIFDCETNFSAKRLAEVVSNHKVDLSNIIIFQIFNKFQQFLTIMQLHKFLSRNTFRFVAINGVTDHYRFVEISDTDLLNQRLLSLQLAYLKKVSDSYKVPILITNQTTSYREHGEKFTRAVDDFIINNYVTVNIQLQHLNKKLWKAKSNSDEMLYSLSSNGLVLDV